MKINWFLLLCLILCPPLGFALALCMAAKMADESMERCVRELENGVDIKDVTFSIPL